jgi:mono/diheme cytochrome c family protein
MSQRQFPGSSLRVMGALGIAVGCVIAAGAARAAGHAGQAPYEQYCASCHGVAADGKGPVAPELKVEPSDLRTLGERYGDPLAKPRLREVIDGRDMPRSHGLPDMPVWGDKLLEGVPPSADGNEFFKRGTSFVIIDYLQTLQQK